MFSVSRTSAVIALCIRSLCFLKSVVRFGSGIVARLLEQSLVFFAIRLGIVWEELRAHLSLTLHVQLNLSR